MVIKRKYIIVMVMLLLAGVLTLTLAYFGVNVIGGPANSSGVLTGKFSLTLSDSVVSISNLSPIYDEYYETQAFSKTFTVTNPSSSTLNVCATVTLNITSIPDALKSQYFKYKIVSSDGLSKIGDFYGASTTEDLILLEGAFLEPNETQTFTLYIWISYAEGVDQSSMLANSLSAIVKVIGSDTRYENACSKWYEECDSTDTNLKCKVLTDNVSYADNVSSPYVTANTGINFTNISSDTNGKGLYYTIDTSKTEDGKRVYYYRGAVTNNYVIFGGFCWKIIRTNEDGSVKLFYWGTSTDNTCSATASAPTSLTSIKFNSTYGDNAYVGYMMGIANECSSTTMCGGSTKTTSSEQAQTNTYESTIKSLLESWYQTNILNQGTNVTNLIKNVIYCNDRYISLKDKIGNVSNTKSGFGTNLTFYGASERIVSETSWTVNSNANPQYKCTQNNDKFTLSVENGGTNGYGNNKLTYPIGLITADEEFYAGGIYGTGNQSYFLYTNNYYWTMSPFRYDSSISRNWVMYSGGYLGNGYVFNSYNVFPTISISFNSTITNGNGTIGAPYLISTN